MLKGLHPLLTPDLLHSLAAMGHGDTIAIVDANFPATSIGRRVHHAVGVDTATLLDAILTVLPLDRYVSDPVVTMQVVDHPEVVPEAVREIAAILERNDAQAAIGIARFAFYDRARSSFAVVQTGEQRAYGNVLLSKGVIATQKH